MALTAGVSPDGTPVKNYKAGDWAYINLHVPFHGTFPWQASENPVKISVYAGNGVEGEPDDLLVSGENQLSTGMYFVDGKIAYYPINLHPYTGFFSGELRGLNLDLRLQMPETDYITAVVEWPYYGKTWKIPIKVMNTNDSYVTKLRNLYNSLRTSTGYDPFRYNLDYIYESEVSKILAADTDAEKAAILEQSLKLVADAAKGVGADAVVWRFNGSNHKTLQIQDSKPILVGVPSNNNGYLMNGHLSTIAALDGAFPNNWTYEYTMSAFGAAVNHVTWGGEDDTGKQITHKGPGFDDGNYGSFFTSAEGYSNVGVSGFKTSDGDVMAWNSPAHEGTWTWALLRYYYLYKKVDSAIMTDEAIEAMVNEKMVANGYPPRDAGYLGILGIAEMEDLFKDIDLDGDGDKTNDFRRYGHFKEETPANEVIRLINAIGSVSPRSKSDIEKARAAYNALSTGEKAKVTNYDVLAAAEETYRNLTASSTSSTWSDALNAALTSFQGKTPVVGSTGGEWTVLAIARQLMTDIDAEAMEDGTFPTDTVFAKKYLAALDTTLGQSGLNGLDPTGNQHTEYSRIVLALSALGIDAENYQAGNGGNYNFIAKLGETDAVISQGINGPIFALLALDSKPYCPENTTLRQTYIDAILRNRTSDGGFSYDGVKSDVDMTAMAIQALAPYYLSDLNVQKAINEALSLLAGMQSPQGGFYSNGTYNSESCSQVIVALTALAYHTGNGTLTGDTWTVCGTTFKNPVNALMAFYKDGKFGHALGEQDDMATEQAAYALVAYSRYTSGRTPLYTMRDAFETSPSTDRDDLEAAKRSVAAALDTLSWLTATTTADAETEIRSQLAGVTLPGGVTAAVTVNTAKAPIDGTEISPNGTPGEVTFTVTLTRGSLSDTVTRSKSFPATPYLSGDFGLRSVTVLGKTGTVDGYAVTVTLEKEKAEQGMVGDLDFQIVPKDSAAVISTPVRQSFDTWTFTITAASGASATYTIRIAASDDAQALAQANVNGAASIVEKANGERLPVGMRTEAEIDGWARALVPGAVRVQSVSVTEIVPPVDGSRDDQDGTNGSAKITMTLASPYEAGPAASVDLDEPKNMVGDSTILPTPPEEQVTPTEESTVIPKGTPIVPEDTGFHEESTVIPEEMPIVPEDTGFHEKEVIQEAEAVPYMGPERATQYATQTVIITVILPAKPYEPSGDTSVASVTYNSTPLTPDESGYNYTLELQPGESVGPTLFVVTVADEGGATVGPVTSAGDGLWQFTVTAENGTKATYTIKTATVSGTLAENQAAVEAAYNNASAMTGWTIPMGTANTEPTVKTYISTALSTAAGNVDCKIEVTNLQPAVEGTAGTPAGTNGSYTAQVTFSKGTPGTSTYVEQTLPISGTITAKAYEVRPEGTISVSFQLLGDDAHGDPGTANTHTLSGGGLQKWIDRTGIEVPAGSTVGDVFKLVLNEAGYTYVGLESNYIKSITKPGGTPLGEFTNGRLSGWMYTVNGTHPDRGLNSWTVYDGNQIVFHYTDNYTLEEGRGGQITPDQPGPGVDTSTYGSALTAALARVAGQTPNPGVRATGGEWAVLGMARGGTITPAVTEKYRNNLYYYARQHGGELDASGYQHTEYSRVILALTALGEDASSYEGYDFVTPLFDNGCQQVSVQGNNGTAFALIALDSGNYRDDTQGNAARAQWINALSSAQLPGGGWPISSVSGGADTDTTAMAVQALAPYYTGRRTLPAGVNSAIVRQMVDRALAFLSGQQTASGGFGSSETDAQIVVMLSALGRDAASDSSFTKGGRSVLEDLLGYRDTATGGFSHRQDSGVDQMATEQAAYALVAYDRYKHSRNTLYDMTDVFTAEAASPVIPIQAVVTGGVPTAAVPAQKVAEAISEAQKTGSGTIAIKTAGGESASAVAVELPAQSMQAAASAGVGMTVKTAKGTVSIPAEAARAIVQTAGGADTIRIHAETKTLSAVHDILGEDLDAGSAVIEVTITANGQPIKSSLGSRPVNVRIPVGRNFTVGRQYDVTVIHSAVDIERNRTGVCARNGSDRYVELTVNRLSTFVVKAVAEDRTVTATAGDNGKITPSGDVTVPNGDSQRFTIEADEGYELKELLLDDEKVQYVWVEGVEKELTSSSHIKAADYILSDVTEDHTLRAEFKRGIQLPDYGPVIGQVTITVENSTYSGGAFTGTMVSGTYDLCQRDTMMTSILKALTLNGYAWSDSSGKDDYDITYIAHITKDDASLGEFDGGSGSGWMGTLNDWFTNEGFQAFRVGGYGGHALEDGDEIHVVYTTNLGADVGGGRGYPDTSLASLDISGGTLVPKFSGDALEYTLMVPERGTDVTVTPHAVNKTFMVKTFLNNYNSESSLYKRTKSIPVKPGDTLYIGVGESGWPTSFDAGSYSATCYTIKVVSSDIQSRIDALPKPEEITYENYKGYVELVERLRKDYDKLKDEEKAEIKAEKLIEVEKRIKLFQEIDKTKELLNAIPEAKDLKKSNARKIQEQVKAAYDAYQKLTEEQQSYIAKEDVTKHNAAVEWLEKLGYKTDGPILIGEDGKKPAALPFTDVDKHWALESIQFVYEHNLMNGTSATAFEPNSEMTRAMFVTVLYRMEGQPSAGTANSFTDVPEGQWYTEAVKWAAANSIVNGMTPDTFQPNANVTREQMAALMFRYAKYKGYDITAAAELGNYTDNGQVHDWAYRAMQWANGVGLIQGRTETTLVPAGTATRAENATILMRFLQRFEAAKYQ